jgi:hypothetical protein
VLRSQESAVGPPRVDQPRRAKRLEQVEQELDVDRPAGERADALGQDECPSRCERAPDFTEGELEIAGDVQGVDAVHERVGALPDLRLAERSVHVEAAR